MCPVGKYPTILMINRIVCPVIKNASHEFPFSIWRNIFPQENERKNKYFHNSFFMWQCSTRTKKNIKHHLHLHLSLNHKGRWGTIDDFAISFLHFSLFSSPLWDLADSRLLHSLMLSSYLFFCLSLSSSPFHCAFQDGFGQTWWTGDMSIPLQFASPHDGQVSGWLSDIWYLTLNQSITLHQGDICLFVSWCFEPSQPPGVTWELHWGEAQLEWLRRWTRSSLDLPSQVLSATHIYIYFFFFLLEDVPCLEPIGTSFLCCCWS